MAVCVNKIFLNGWGVYKNVSYFMVRNKINKNFKVN